MRFVLDQDVDARVAKVIAAAGHEVWTVASAGLAEAQDDDLTLYAQRKNAALVTHDREFSRRRRRNPIGQHVHLDCLEPTAREVVATNLAEIVNRLNPFADVYVRVTTSQVMHETSWT